MHPKKIIRYFYLNPFEAKKLTQILLGSQYGPGMAAGLPVRALDQTELIQLFKDLQQLTRIQLQWDKPDQSLEGIGPDPIAARLWIDAYDNEPGTEIGIQVEYIYTPKGHTSINPTREMQYASFAYTGADTDQPFAINWDQQPGK